MLVAGLLGVSEKTIWNWLNVPGGRIGRPATSDENRHRAFRAVVRTCRRIGWSAGWRKVQPALEGRVPVRLVQQCLSRAKRLHARHEERRLSRHRVHVEVLAANVLWHQDATHLGRTAGGEIQGDIVRDAAARDVLGASVGGVVTAEDAIQNLEAAIVAAGAPLVVSTDNGSPYRSDAYEACVARHRIVHLKNLPGTPQHNARAERVIRDVKEESGLGRGALLASADEAADRVAVACATLERRASLAAQAVPAPVQYTLEDRERFHEAVCRRIAAVVQCAPNARARCMATREAIHAELEERGLIRRTRGGAALRRSKAEIKS